MTQLYKVSIDQYDEGEESPLAPLAYMSTLEFPEFTWSRSANFATASIVSDISEQHRFEIQAHCPKGFLVGAIVAVVEDDQHVGPCLSAMWNYVVEEHRGPIGSLMFREFVWLARTLGTPTVAYSHRISEGVYQIKYRRIKPHG